MIKANELRVGNLVLEDGEIYKVVLADFYNMYLDEGVNKLQTIPLTEEILLKCGFDKEKSADIYEYDVYSIQISNNRSLCYCKHPLKNSSTGEETIDDAWWFDDFYAPSFTNFGDDFWRKPKHLHQLQNLYWCLTGEELNVQI